MKKSLVEQVREIKSPSDLAQLAQTPEGKSVIFSATLTGQAARLHEEDPGKVKDEFAQTLGDLPLPLQYLATDALREELLKKS